MDLREVAVELYAAAPAEFVSRRAAAAEAAKGDRKLVEAIRALRKPTASAAAINALVRERPGSIDDVIEIGDRMREAFAARDRVAIRALTRDRQRLLQKATRGLGLSAAVQREVEETLQAAVIDTAAAAAVRSGMLLRALESTGVDQVDVSAAAALPIDVDPSPPQRTTRASPADPRSDAGTEESPQETAAERRERQRRIRTAEKAVARARVDAEGLDDELDAEVDRRTDLEGERETLERRLERTTEELREARVSERDLRKRIGAAQTALRAAERKLREARES